MGFIEKNYLFSSITIELHLNVKKTTSVYLFTIDIISIAFASQIFKFQYTYKLIQRDENKKKKYFE